MNALKRPSSLLLATVMTVALCTIFIFSGATAQSSGVARKTQPAVRWATDLEIRDVGDRYYILWSDGSITNGEVFAGGIIVQKAP